MEPLYAFFLGQISIAILIFAFIYVFIFGEPPATSPRPRRHSHSLLSPRRLRQKQSTLQRPSNPPVTPSAVLAKTFYNVRGHQPESLDWFNVLIAQTLASLRTEALHDNALLKSLGEVLNGSAMPGFVGGVNVTELSLGEEFPIFSNCRIIPVDDAGAEVRSLGDGTRLLARLDVDLSDAITLGIETKLVLNYPFANTAVLPAALAVSIVRFSGTLSLSFIPSVPEQTDEDMPPSPGPITLAFSFLPDYRLDLEVRSLLGSRSRLQDVPKIAQLVEHRIHAWLEERCVEPRYQQIVLPNIWPRSKNTRGPQPEDSAIDDQPEVEQTEADAITTTGAQVFNNDFEARMAAEGRKLLASEGRLLPDGSPTKPNPRKRISSFRRSGNTENLQMPGRFDIS